MNENPNQPQPAPAMQGPVDVAPVAAAPKKAAKMKAPKAPKAPKALKESRRGRKATGRPVDAAKATPKAGKNMGVMAVIAAVAALLIAVLFLGRTTPEPSSYVVYSKTAIGSGVQATTESIMVISLPANRAPDSAVKASTETEAINLANELIIGKRAVYPIYPQQPLQVEMFTTKTLELSADQNNPLTANERLISISASAATSLAGNLQVGDIVDVVAVTEGVALSVADGVEIVAVSVSGSALRSAAQAQLSADGSDLSAAEILPSDPIPGVYTLRVDASVALDVIAADASSQVYLVGRTADAVNLEGVVSAITKTCAENPAISVCSQDPAAEAAQDR